MALSTSNSLMQAAQRILGLIVVKFGNRPDRLPTHRSVAVLARDVQVAMRAAGHRRARLLREGRGSHQHGQRQTGRKQPHRPAGSIGEKVDHALSIPRLDERSTFVTTGSGECTPVSPGKGTFSGWLYGRICVIATQLGHTMTPALRNITGRIVAWMRSGQAGRPRTAGLTPARDHAPANRDWEDPGAGEFPAARRGRRCPAPRAHRQDSSVRPSPGARSRAAAPDPDPATRPWSSPAAP